MTAPYKGPDLLAETLMSWQTGWQGGRELSSALTSPSLMTAAQLSVYRTLRSEISAARSAYHAALSAGSSDSVRHEAESRCSAAMAAMQEWQSTL
jgi:glucose-6-phosphate-specific signal transduction histidine kinase